MDLFNKLIQKIQNLEKEGKHGSHSYTGNMNLPDRQKILRNVIVRVFFPDLNDLTSAYITYWDESEKKFIDFVYGVVTSQLFFEEDDNYPTDLYTRYILLECDEEVNWETRCIGVETKSKFEVSVE